METGKKIRVFLVDDHRMFRAGMEALIAAHRDLVVVGQSGGGPGVLDEIEKADPNVVVMDISIPCLNGLDLCRELTRRRSELAVLILTMHASEELVVRALEYGAGGYLQKEAAPEDFAKAVRTVAKGGIYLGAGIPRTVLQRLGKGGHDPYETLSTRERQVLQLIAEGKTNREIAAHLQTALKTIDNHRMHLMRKLNIHDQTSLVKFAIRRGLINLGG